MLIDVPFYVGCFNELETLSGGTSIGEANDAMTPAVCITKCVVSDSSKRYASKLGQ